MTMNTILLADDDIELTQLLSEYLQREGFAVTVADDGEAALQRALQQTFDIMILDIMMPKLNGFDVLRQLRKHSNIPVIMLTARGEDIDNIVGLEIGADEYLSKPCSPRVLVAHIRALLRRTSTPQAENDHLSIDGLQIWRGSRRVLLHDTEIVLTNAEFNILHLLMENAGNPVSKQQLFEHAMGRKMSAYDRSLDMHISNLRKKLQDHDHYPERIITLRGLGYQLVVAGHE